MEYCKEFDDIKSVLNYCNNNVQKYVNLGFRSGNDRIVNEISKRIQDLLLEQHHLSKALEPLPKSYAVLRKILLFLVLNSDVPRKTERDVFKNLTHVSDVCPLLPKFLLVAIIWELKFDELFYELISYTPCWFTYPLIEIVLESFRYIDDVHEVMEKGAHVVRAMYNSLTNTMNYACEPNDTVKINRQFHELITRILQRVFSPPDSENIKRKKANARVSGYLVKHIINLIIFAYNAHCDPASCMPNKEVDFYDGFLQENFKESDSDGKKEVEKNVQELQPIIITALLNTLEINIIEVNIDKYVYWAEIDVPNGQHLQAVIGKLAYDMKEKLKSSNFNEHNVFEKIDFMASHPVSMEEDIKEEIINVVQPESDCNKAYEIKSEINLNEILKRATINDILQNLEVNQSYEIKKSWFEELFNRSSIAFGNDECIDTIKMNIKLMSTEKCKAILDFIKDDLKRTQEEQTECESNDYMDLDNDSYEELGSIILRTLENLNNDSIIDLLVYQRQLFGENANICCQNYDFHLRSTQFFKADFEFQKFLILCFENPAEMWGMFIDWTLRNVAHISNFCTTVKKTRPFSNEYFNNCFNEALLDPDKVRQKHVPTLICQVYVELYYTERKLDFFKQFVCKYVQKYLVDQDFESVLPFVNALKEIGVHAKSSNLKLFSFEDITPQILLMVAQILDVARWDLITYTDARYKVVEECINLINETLKTFLPIITEKERKWISEEIAKTSLCLLTQFYFQNFSIQKDKTPLNFCEFVIPESPATTEETHIALVYHYVRCTKGELMQLMQNKLFLSNITQCTLKLGKIVEEKGDLNALDNYTNCIAMYADVVEKILLVESVEDRTETQKIFLDIFKVIESAPDAVYDTVFLNLGSLLINNLRSCLPLDEAERQTLLLNIVNIKSCSAKKVFLNKFETLSLRHDE